MEIARLEVSMQQHLDRMQETAKVNYVQYGKLTKSKKKKPQSNAGATSQGAGGHKGAGAHRPLQQGLGPVNPYISMMRDSQSTLTWLVSPMQTNI